MSPRISVCIPVKNGGEFLPLAVESVLTQARDDFELIIVDNCSTDGTTEWIEKRAASDRRIRFFRNPVDIGMTANFNACLKHAAGKYVTLLCADDVLLPLSLQRMSQALDGDPRVIMVVGARRLIDESGAKIATQKYAGTDTRLPGRQVINRCIFGANYIGEPSAVMFRREMAQRGFREALSQLMDLEMWFYLLEQGDMANLKDEVCAVRRHPGQITQQSIKTGVLIDENVILFKEYGSKPYIDSTFLNGAMRKIRMAYRVWMCRDSMSAEKRNQILAGHSSRLFYFLMMPAIAGLLAAWRKLATPARWSRP
jgi:glycosyltransferase involved in cell wall biosynthesis